MHFIIISVLFVSVVLMMFFSALETAFASVSRLNMELKKKQGVPGSAALARMLESPSPFIGFTITGYHFFLVSFVLSVHTLRRMLLTPPGYPDDQEATDLHLTLQHLAEIMISVLVVLVITDFIPKVLARVTADRFLLWAARSGLLLSAERAIGPITQFFVRCAYWLMEVFFNQRVEKKKAPFSRSDIDLLLPQHGNDQELNTELFEAALLLPQVKVRQCLVPRKEIESIEIHATMEEVRKKLVDTRLSKLVVYEQSIDQVAGYLHQLDLFKNPSSIKEILLPIPAVPESMGVSDLMKRFTRERKSIAWVVDEFGGTAGIVTMEDLLEEIFGEIRDEYDVEEFVEKKISDTDFIFSGRLELDLLKYRYGLEFPENDSETLSGYIIHQHETIPRQKERIVIGRYEFEILQVSDTRIEMVRIKMLQ